MKYKKIIITVLILIVAMPVTKAVDQRASQQLKNVSVFLKSFVDLDSSLNYWSDSLKKNDCIKRDVMSIHAQKSLLSDQMIDNYRTMTDVELVALKYDYALLDSELTFVRLGLKDEAERNRKVAIRANKLVVGAIGANIEDWTTNKYADKLGIEGEYQNCPKAWDEVVMNWRSLKDNLETIQVENAAFKKQLKDTANEGLSTAQNTYGSVSRIYRETRDGLEDSITESVANASQTLSRSSINQSDYLDKLEEEYNALNSRQEVASVLEIENSLTEIPAILSQSDHEVAQNLELLVSDNSLDYVTRYQDSVALVFLSTNQEINDTLRVTNNSISNDGIGLIDLLKEISSRQCR